MKYRHLLLILSLSFISACSGSKSVNLNPLQPSDGHLKATDVASAQSNGDIPQANKRSIPLPPPKPSSKVETYSVVVTNVPAQEILFALARDAKINLDIAPGVQGNVTINAINQTLPQILDRISSQVDIRYEIKNGTMSVMPDKPYLKTYQIDFINMARTVKSSLVTSSRVGGSAGASGGTTSGGNTASTTITSDTKNDLMTSLVKNVTEILIDEDKFHFQEQQELKFDQAVSAKGTGAASGASQMDPTTTGGKGNPGTGGKASGAGNEDLSSEGNVKATKGVYERAVNVFANNETGVLIVRATSRQHEKVQEFIDKVMGTAKRQVLIEATVVEVTLSRQYQQGINWSTALTGSSGFSATQGGTAATGTIPSTNVGSIFTLNYQSPNSSIGAIAASVKMMESFGTVKVLSSPKLSVMNNQTATLKVVDSKIYFDVQAQTSQAVNTSLTTFTTTAKSVDVGFVMNVTPYISSAESVTMNIRPTISRITGYINDPNPSLAAAGVTNQVPEIQSREIESIIKIESGQIAVLGGLMQDSINNLSDGIPGLSSIPYIGNLFKYRNDTSSKSELVIFIRPIVIKEASVDGDFSEYRNNLPDSKFFEDKPAKSEPQDKQKL